MKKQLWLLPLVMFSLLFAQGTYYNGIDPNSSDFITKLGAKLIQRTNNSYSAFSTFARTYEKRPDGKVYCVYINQDETNTFNREHTWCNSWMPTNPNGSGSFEYADYHNLFPTNVNANSVRGNLAFGKVVSGETFNSGGSKCGKDANGKTVFEPRDAHKGDAARTLMYMAVCYNGYLNTNWSIGALSAGQDVDVLLSWHQQDPPDAWEKAINEAVFNQQGNRNPFVDHPEWTTYINFNNLTYIPQVTINEPTNYPSNFAAGTTTDNTIQVNWTDAVAGTQAPTGYLVQLKTADSFTAPADGFPVADDLDITDGSISVNVAYTGADTYTFTGLSSGTYYFARIYSYNSASGTINYKTDGTVPSVSQQTTGIANPANFNPMTISETQINLYWLKNNAADNVVIAYNTTNTFGTPQNGTAYTADQQINGGGTVIYIGASTVFAHTGLTAATTYYYKIWSVSSTNNYSAGLTQSASTQGGGGTGNFATDLIISEYVEGSSSNKAIEIFNGTGLPVNLNGYSLRKQNNGAGAFSGPVVINRTLPHNQTFVLANAAATFAADTLIAYETNPTLSFNGNDAVGLFKGETMIDIVGVANSVANWGLDMTLVRNSNIKSPSATYNAADWTQFAKDTFTGLGNHTMDLVAISNYSAVTGKNLSVSNYPNPFNPSTSITFNVKNNQQVQLMVYNVAGKRVYTHNQNCTAGQNSIKWNAADLPAGIYLYSISADGILMNGKMSLIK